MPGEDAKFWFGQAYDHMAKEDFASAAKCFEHVIQDGKDPYASSLAKQRIQWYCVPLESILKKMEECQNPIDVYRVLAELFASDSEYIESEQQSIIREVEKELAKLSSVMRVGNKVWVKKEIFDKHQKKLAQAILQSSKLLSISNWLHNQFQDCELPENYPDHITLGVFEIGLHEYPIVYLTQDFAISKKTLSTQIDALVTYIRDIGQPISLNQLMDILFPGESPELTSQIAYSLKGQLDSRFVEVAQGMIFLGDLVKLDSDLFEDIFLMAPEPLTTEKLVRSRLLSNQTTPPLTQQFRSIAEHQLAQNQNLRQIGQSYWITKSLERELGTRAENYLLNEGTPQSSQTILEKIRPTDSVISINRDPLINLVDDVLKVSQNVLMLGYQTWIHLEVVKKASDKSYQQLLSSTKPLTTIDLLRTNLGVTKAFFNQILIQYFENLLSKDTRFIHELSLSPHHWRAVDPRKADNQAAFQALKQAHNWLSGEEITALLSHQGISSPTFELTSDDRFKPFPPDRWGLKEWVSINELAYNYLLTSHQALHEIAIIGLICRDNHIRQENAIFTPSEDSRFSQDSINRWFCRHSLSATEMDRLHEELIKYGGTGRKIDILIRQVLHKDVDATDAEIKMSADERFIHLDKLWFARQAAFYTVTAEDVDNIYNTLASQANLRRAISLKELVNQAIGHDGRLTDADAWLSNDPRFLHVRDDFWTLRNTPSPDFDRSGAGGVAVFHTAKDQPLLDDGAGTVDKELTHRKSRPQKDKDTTEPRKKEYRTLTHLDILHGNLRIAGMLKHWIPAGVANIHCRDEEDYEFIAYIDETGSILNIREWLKKRDLTYGDKISIQPALQQDGILIRPYGTRDEGVYQEAVDHQEIERLIEEARKVNKSFHDLMIEVMEAFDYPLHREDLYQLVNYQRTASRATISEILSLPDCPYEELRYFIPVGAGSWKFDRKRKDAYDMKMQELLAENDALQNQLVNLKAQLESQKSLTDRTQTLSEQNELLLQSIAETKNKVEKLRKENTSAEQTITELKAELKSQREQVTILQTKIAESRAAGERVQTQPEQEENKLQEQINTLADQVKGLQNEAKVLQEWANFEINEVREKLETERNEREQLTIKNSSLEAELATTKAIKERLQKEIDQAKRIESLGKDDKLDAVHVTPETELGSLKKEIERLNYERAEIVGKLEMDLKEANESKENLQKEMEQLRRESMARIGQLDEELEAGQTELAQSKEMANPPAPLTFKQIMQLLSKLLFHRNS